MSRSEDGRRLRRALDAEVASRLAVNGWRSDPSAVVARDGLKFAKQVDRDFTLVAHVMFSAVAGILPNEVYEVSVGLVYEPLWALDNLLGAYGGPVVQWSADPGGMPGADDDSEPDDEEEDFAKPDDHYEFKTASEVRAVAERIATTIEQRGRELSEQITTVDALLDRLRDEQAMRKRPDLRRAAVFAAARRLRAAAAELDLELARGEADERTTRTARQLRRWIDSGGDPAIIPTEPPPDPWESWQRTSIGELHRAIRSRHEAIEQVRASSTGKSRDELRATLGQELERRGLHLSETDIDTIVDHLHDSKAEQLQRTASALIRGGLALTGAIGKAVRARELPDLEAPEWLAPPERAAYTVPRGGWGKTDVRLTDDVIRWLDEVQEEIPAIFGVSALRAWLCWDPEPRQDGSVLAAYLGERRVGEIAPGRVSAFSDVMEAASFREECPVVQATLRRLSEPPRYALTLTEP